MRGVIRKKPMVDRYGMLYALFRQPVLMELQFVSEFIDHFTLTDVLVLEVLQLCHDLISGVPLRDLFHAVFQNADLFFAERQFVQPKFMVVMEVGNVYFFFCRGVHGILFNDN